jgi:alpha-tubulin suppressor-like RCC1 family protein
MQPYRRLQHFRSSFTGWALGLALLLGGCGGGSSGGDEPIASVTAEVGASGGALALQGLALTVAPNAVTGPVTVGVVALTAGTGEIARFQLSPAGRALGVASELRFSRAGLPAKTSFFWDVGGELRLVPSTLVGDVLTAQVSSLGLSASGSVVSALASTPVGRVKALFAKTLADAPGDGGTVVVKPLDCAADIAKMAARLKVVASGRDQELTIRFYDELVAVKQLCLEAEVQALKDSSCDAMGTAQSKAETVLADSFLTFQELTLPLFAAEAFVQETGATCPSADSARVGPLIADKFDQFLRVLQSQQLRGGFAEEATARDFQVLLDLNARCGLLGLDAVCDRLDNEIIPNLFDGMRRGAFDECRSSGSPLVVSQLHFLGTMVTDTDRFLGVGRFGLGDVEADLMYCTNPTLDLRVFADATGIPDELTDRATTLSPLVGLGNYPRTKSIELPRDGSLTVAGDVAALRCADGSVSPADLVARIGTREVARRSVTGNVYPLSTAPLDLVVSRMLASAGLDVDNTRSFTVKINREGGQCLGALGPTLNEDRTLFEIQVNLASVSAAGTRISVGVTHVCALTPGGGAKCWGGNNAGQLGMGSLTNLANGSADVVGLATDVVSISSGSEHSCALTGAGAVKCWGNKLDGDGNLVPATISRAPVDVPGLTGRMAAVSTGSQHACVLTAEGAVQCWGHNEFGQLGDGTTTQRTTPAGVVGLDRGVLAVSAGGANTCALLADGAVKCWGLNDRGQLGDGTTINRLAPVTVTGLAGEVVAVSAGGSNTCALTRAGGVKCWGENTSGQLGNGQQTVGNGGLISATPVDVSGLGSGVSAVSAGGQHACALTTAGGVMCWGFNGNGALGNGTLANSPVPVGVIGLASGVTQVSAGVHASCAIAVGGSFKCWGANFNGMLGDGTLDFRTTPVNVIPFVPPVDSGGGV